MRILYIHQYFKTPQEGGAIRSYLIAKSLVKAGHEVIMVTSHNQSDYEIKNIEGIEVHYLPVSYNNSFGFTKRILSFYQFYKKGYRFAKKLKNIDLCYASSTPLTVGFLALNLKKKFGLPYIFEVRDLWPEAPIQLGVIKASFLKKWLYKKELQVYKSASKVVALSPGIRTYIEGKVPHKSICLVSNMADVSYFPFDSKPQNLIEKYGVTNKKVVSYLGALSMANNVEHLVEIANHCQQQQVEDVHFIIAGEGKSLPFLRKLAADYGLKNLTFYGFGSKEHVKEILQISDATFTTFAPYPVLETNSPNKFFDSLAAGKLTLINTNGWIKEIVASKKCGFVINNGNEFVAHALPILRDSITLSTYQKNARNLAENHFNKDFLCEKVIKFIDPNYQLKATPPEVYTLIA